MEVLLEPGVFYMEEQPKVYDYRIGDWLDFVPAASKHGTKGMLTGITKVNRVCEICISCVGRGINGDPEQVVDVIEEGMLLKWDEIDEGLERYLPLPRVPCLMRVVDFDENHIVVKKIGIEKHSLQYEFSSERCLRECNPSIIADVDEHIVEWFEEVEKEEEAEKAVSEQPAPHGEGPYIPFEEVKKNIPKELWPAYEFVDKLTHETEEWMDRENPTSDEINKKLDECVKLIKEKHPEYYRYNHF